MTDLRNRESEHRYPAPPRSSRPGRPFTIGAFIAAAVAVLFLPPFAGLVGVVLGIVGWARGDRPLAGWAIAAAVAGAVVGMVLGAVLLQAANSDAVIQLF